MKILVAVDKTEESQMALRYCCHLMEHFTAIVDALYVKPDVVETVAEGGRVRALHHQGRRGAEH